MMLARRASMDTARTSPRRPIIAWLGPGIVWLGLGAICLLASTCASASNALTSPTEFDSLVPGWQSKFSLDFKVQPSKNGTNIVYGRIHSHYGQFAASFRVLGLAVDPSGKVIAQRIGLVPGGVPGFGQVYFEIDKMVAAASYRVTVFDYTFIEARGGVIQ
jgi:hypothetical protein